ncbi:hypothetical protein [Frankia sp. QA3]|uniref:hypothetical protein n=1 Tax=Frankia sp. QA3 TaxID=710111 RepID=UPI000269C204|nr:hypothetical protein [Frankia sp. QA3]EIV92124.1 hypothetical protein FraQA3DRAFT_1633 [Frankia sp. QA3]
MWSTVLSVSMAGPVDLETLSGLRRSLDLRPHGRLDDDDDGDFGYRYLVDDGVERRVLLTLWRNRPDEWMVTLLATPADVPDETGLTQLLAEIRAAAQSAGLTVTREGVWPA